MGAALGAGSWPGKIVLVNLSGRGDKDVAQVADTARRDADADAVRRCEATLRRPPRRGRKLLVPYVTGGFDDGLADMVRAMAAAGADAIEIGIPFSDPVMDGPTIQEASERALAGAQRPPSILDELRGLGVDAGVPLVVMTYYNIVFRAGHERFARRWPRPAWRGDRARPAARGDRPVGRGRRRRRRRDRAAGRADRAPTSGCARICERSRGFVYGVGLLGVTGERACAGGPRPR